MSGQRKQRTYQNRTLTINTEKSSLKNEPSVRLYCLFVSGELFLGKDTTFLFHDDLLLWRRSPIIINQVVHLNAAALCIPTRAPALALQRNLFVTKTDLRVIIMENCKKSDQRKVLRCSLGYGKTVKLHHPWSMPAKDIQWSYLCYSMQT